ncbi:universal stress protein [Rhodocytophaga aerolata]|uniref:Universal stress protein n=1 Tax=Rhodocytophaga aerolata TaxID=455078 RepID=A0ABT8R4Z4_9BACT|nr:universal stress protein [Rhodocytophaga aerolata]MDO1446363.1 universal stress protein [Rhodocytophaga aerolata]
MKTILVPTDFSANARNATLYAAALARKMESKIILLHTFQTPVLTSQTLVAKYMEEKAAREYTRKMDFIADELTYEYGLTVEKLIQPGNLPDVLPRLVEEKAVELVVLGIQETSPVERLLVGSMTASIVKQATFPVLIIPFTATFAPIKRIVFACQYEYLSGQNMVPQLKEIARAYHAEIEILQIDGNEAEEVNIRERVETGHYLERMFKGVPHSYRFIDNRHVVEGIETEVQESQADLLVMVPRKHTFWDYLLNKSTTQQMLFHTNVPLLALPNPN